MDQLAKARPSIGADHRHRTRRLAVTYQTIEVVERAGHGEETIIVGEFDSEDEADGQAIALHDARGGYLRVVRIETRTTREVGIITIPRIVASGSAYYATSPRKDGIYHLKSNDSDLPERIVFTSRSQAGIVMRAIAEAVDNVDVPF